MKINTQLSTLLLSMLTFMALPAVAQQKLITGQSDIGFTFKQMGVHVDGRFKKFDAQIHVDSAKLTASTVNLSIDIASATLGSPEIDAELPKAPWFNTAKFPQATFASSAFKSLGAGKYEATGKLSVKGQSQNVVIPLTMTQVGGNTTAAGVFQIKRLAFKIGENEWADTSMVADDVQVKFKLTLSGVGKLQ